MAHLWGWDVSRERLLESVGDISQIARVRASTLTEGPEEGVAALDFQNGSGLTFTVLPGRGMDISAANFNGRSLAWRSATGDIHSSHFEPSGLGWLRGFSGGLLTTCGLSYAGAPCDDTGDHLGLHGRASYTPASEVSWGGEWDEDDYTLYAEGMVREASVFGPNLALRRGIYAPMGQPRIYISDRVENRGYANAPHMIVYHINIGFPVVAEGSRFVATVAETHPRNDHASSGLETSSDIPQPQPGFQEMVYYHTPRANLEGEALAGVVNRKLELGVAVRYDPRQLPRLIQWKMVGQGHYVIGIEPANCWADGRAAERAAGALVTLAPGEYREYDLIIDVLDGKDAVDEFLEEVSSDA